MRLKSTVLVVAVTILGVLAFSNICPVYGQATSMSSGAYKIGIVDLQQIMDNYDKRNTEVESLEKEVADRKAELDDDQAEFERSVEKFAEKRDAMSEEERAERAVELDTRALAIQSDVRQAEALFEGKSRRLKQSLLKDIVRAVSEVGAEGDYHLVLEADPETRTGVIYHSPTLDMTQKVIDRLNG